LHLVRELTGGCCIDRESKRAKVSRGWLARRVALATLVVPHPSGVRPPVGRPENHPRTPTTILSISLFLSLSLSFSLYLSTYLFIFFSLSSASRSIRTEQYDRWICVRTDLYPSLLRSAFVERCASFLSEIIGTRLLPDNVIGGDDDRV